MASTQPAPSLPRGWHEPAWGLRGHGPVHDEDSMRSSDNAVAVTDWLCFGSPAALPTALDGDLEILCKQADGLPPRAQAWLDASQPPLNTLPLKPYTLIFPYALSYSAPNTDEDKHEPILHLLLGRKRRGKGQGILVNGFGGKPKRVTERRSGDAQLESPLACVLRELHEETRLDLVQQGYGGQAVHHGTLLIHAVDDEEASTDTASRRHEGGGQFFPTTERALLHIFSVRLPLGLLLDAHKTEEMTPLLTTLPHAPLCSMPPEAPLLLTLLFASCQPQSLQRVQGFGLATSPVPAPHARIKRIRLRARIDYVGSELVATPAPFIDSADNGQASARETEMRRRRPHRWRAEVALALLEPSGLAPGARSPLTTRSDATSPPFKRSAQCRYP